MDLHTIAINPAFGTFPCPLLNGGATAVFFEPSLIDSVSIRGRVAFAVTCLESVCDALVIEAETMSALIRLFWTFTQSRSLDAWESEVLEALPPDRRDASAHANRLGFSHLDERHQEFVTDLVNLVVDIGCANQYAGFVSTFTREPTFAVAQLLHAKGFPVPEIEPFCCSSVEEDDGWGHPIERKAFPRMTRSNAWTSPHRDAWHEANIAII